MKQIKNIMMLIVVMFVCVSVNAQMVSWHDHMYLGINGYKYDRGDIPGGAWMATGDNVMSKVNTYFMRLRHDDPEAYVREYNAFMMRGGLAGIQPVGTLAVNYGGGMVGGGMMMGGGAMMVGGGMNGGMVYGNSGMAGAMSNVVIDNSNLAETIGSGINMTYDTGSNSMSISGDPITAGLRLITVIGSKTKKNRNRRTQQQVVYQQQTNGYANGQVLQDANGNQYVVNNGVLVPVQTRSAQPVQQVQTRTTNTTNRTNVQTNGQVTYNVSAGGFVSGF